MSGDLKPGTVCYLVNLRDAEAEFIGRVVTVTGVGYVDFVGSFVLPITPYYVCQGSVKVAAVPQCLLPISNPDQEVTQDTHKEMETQHGL